MNQTISQAVEPLRTEAMKRSEIKAVEIALSVAKELVENGNDLRKAAPYPKTAWSGNHPAEIAKHRLFGGLVHHVGGCRGMNDPDPVVMHSVYVDRFVDNARTDASAQYDSFIAKLESKIGDYVTAELKGDHVWGYSILTVTKADGSVENWKTSMIVNVSKLGKVFNQFPTRKVK